MPAALTPWQQAKALRRRVDKILDPYCTCSRTPEEKALRAKARAVRKRQKLARRRNRR